MFNWFRDFFLFWGAAASVIYGGLVTTVLFSTFIIWDADIIQDLWLEHWWLERVSIALGFLVSLTRFDMHGDI
jgi:hypothetical protein